MQGEPVMKNDVRRAESQQCTISFLAALSCTILIFFSQAYAQDSKAEVLASEISAVTGIHKGICVHLGGNDAELTAAIYQEGRFLVHGLNHDADTVRAMRKQIRALNLYGPVSVEQFGLDRLPYISNCINLLVVDDLTSALKKDLSFTEIMRVLTPNGAVCIGNASDNLKEELLKAGFKDYKVVKRSRTWTVARKPRPPHLDEWTHWNHGPNGNRASRDTSDPPTRLQWIDGPTAKKDGIEAAVSTNGRLIYSYGGQLTARDGHNGFILWQRPFSLRSHVPGPRGYLAGRVNTAPCLTAAGNRIYTVLEKSGNLVALDVETGEEIQSYPGNSPHGIIHYQKGKREILVLNRDEEPLWGLDAQSGKQMWQYDKHIDKFGIYVASDQVLFNQGSSIVSLDVVSGEKRWQQDAPGKILFCYQGVLITKEIDRRKKITLAFNAYSLDDGKHLWRHVLEKAEMITQPEVYGVRKRVWYFQSGKDPKRGSDKVFTYVAYGLNPISGKVEQEIRPTFDMKNMIRKRCAPGVATEYYYLAGTRTALGWERGEIPVLPSARKACKFGFLPTNGLVYTFPRHGCNCYKWINGTLALAPPNKTRQDKSPAKGKDRLLRGMTPELGPSPKDDEWPAFRHDMHRSGFTPNGIKSSLRLLWEAKVGSSLSAPTVAGELVFVAARNSLRLDALDAKTGKARWHFITEGPVNIPPCIANGLAVFGGNDGYVYCLEAKNGKLAWRFLAAPKEKRMMAFGRMESPWPVQNGVTIARGCVSFAAGRASDFEGGVCAYGLELKTGKLLWEKQFLGKAVERNKGDASASGKVVQGGTRFDPKSGKVFRQGGRPRKIRSPNGSYWLGSPRPPKGKPPIYTVGGLAKGKRKEDAWSMKLPGRGIDIIQAGETLVVACENEKGKPSAKGILFLLSLDRGKVLGEYPLKSPSADNGIVAAYGRFYISTQDGNLLCYGPKE